LGARHNPFEAADVRQTTDHPAHRGGVIGKTFTRGSGERIVGHGANVVHRVDQGRPGLRPVHRQDTPALAEDLFFSFSGEKSARETVSTMRDQFQLGFEGIGCPLIGEGGGARIAAGARALGAEASVFLGKKKKKKPFGPAKAPMICCGSRQFLAGCYGAAGRWRDVAAAASRPSSERLGPTASRRATALRSPHTEIKRCWPCLPNAKS